jgi:hypothetical protein
VGQLPGASLSIVSSPYLTPQLGPYLTPYLHANCQAYNKASKDLVGLAKALAATFDRLYEAWVVAPGRPADPDIRDGDEEDEEEEEDGAGAGTDGAGDGPGGEEEAGATYW